MVNGFSHSTGLRVLQTGEQLLFVDGSRRGQQHRVDVVGRDRVEGIGGDTRAGGLCGNMFGLLGEVVVDHGHACPADPLRDPFDVVGTHHADAEHGNRSPSVLTPVLLHAN